MLASVTRYELRNRNDLSGTSQSAQRGLYDAGKTLLVESVAVGRDFCKSTITVATSAIPIYTALVRFAVGKHFRPKFHPGLLLALARSAFLLTATATAFALGYFPKRSTFPLDVPAEIENARKAAVSKRLR